MFREFMEYKSVKFGVNLILANQWFPSSKKCSCCGQVKDNLGLSERTFTCTVCGYEADRDLNDALNLEKYPGPLGNLTPVDNETSALEKYFSKRAFFDVSFLDEAGTEK